MIGSLIEKKNLLFFLVGSREERKKGNDMFVFNFQRDKVGIIKKFHLFSILFYYKDLFFLPFSSYFFPFSKDLEERNKREKKRTEEKVNPFSWFEIIFTKRKMKEKEKREEK